MRVAVYTLGCKVNQYESQFLCERFLQRGHQIVAHTEPADVYIVNSCTVTATSDSKSKKMVGHFRKQNPDAVVALIGCFPQAFPEKAYEVKTADIVLGNAEKGRVVELCERCFADKERREAVCDQILPAEIEPMCISRFEERTRAFVKIQDGCNRFCSYCIIPKARGRICSKPINEIVEEITALSKNGYSEIVLVGIDLSSYGKQFGKTLTDAVEAVAKIDGVKKIRLGSLEPEIISDEDLKRLSKIEKFCPQFHLSLQSGCDKTLKRMNRHYNCDEYREIVNKIRAAFENASITTDVMVGFAGESDEDFKASLEFVKSIGFLKVHVFPYSVRKGTRAAEFEGHIDGETKKKRARIMLSETEKIRREILENQIGKTVEVLVESRIKNNCAFGYTKDYLPVFVEDCSLPVGSFCTVKIENVKDDGCIATGGINK
ncbi:MAG: tRNA (N(6)-L-threonylcarbamoyladenosine(37)-C(2))-methylthiotransferase MtaB [Oscillospiraceae bacterium]|nr:tRNA (N(6)-L-threonylcarbamoyladenosine(37)-C(2))-methylthiotransferase MtaB [Oscillospiraceae bacterium]